MSSTTDVRALSSYRNHATTTHHYPTEQDWYYQRESGTRTVSRHCQICPRYICTKIICMHTYVHMHADTWHTRTHARTHAHTHTHTQNGRYACMCKPEMFFLLFLTITCTVGTVAEGAPIIPISAQLKYNIEVVCEYITKKVPIPKRNFLSPPRLIGKSGAW